MLSELGEVQANVDATVYLCGVSNRLKDQQLVVLAVLREVDVEWIESFGEVEVMGLNQRCYVNG